MQAVSHIPATRRQRKQRACTECQRRKQRCIFRDDGLPCTNCSRRSPLTPVVCSINLTEGHETRLGERIIYIGPQAITSRDIRLSLQERRRPSSNNQLPPIANAEWLRADPQYGPVNHHQCALTRSGTNLILDGRGDPSTLRPFGGILTDVNCIGSLPIQQTARNAELLHFYLRFVVPNLVSIDGESQPDVFLREVLPWQLQSPVFPNIGLLMASVTQSLDRGVELEDSPETFAMKARALSCINQYLDIARTNTFHRFVPEAIKCVINLVVMEWFWGSDDSMRAHQRGIKEMIRLAGGLSTFDPVIAGITILTDYEISCGFETDVCWQDDGPTLSDKIPVPTTWATGFDSPLVASAISFQTNVCILDLTDQAAQILDDIRFLIVSITSPTTERNTTTTTTKIKSTASWLLAKLESIPVTPSKSERDWITHTIRLAALIHCRSVATVTPISQLPVSSEDLYVTMRKVSLSRWKKIPGIFLWIMLVLCPSSKSDKRGRFIRRKMAVAGLSIGFEDFPLGISFLRAFWLVQRWIVAQRGDM